ncbi:MAG: type II toxin-antitoxin system VapC family toxin [Candidatus Anammoxibacter sp.]
MNEFLLDADVIIWFLRGDKLSIDLLKNKCKEGILACSAITVLEVEAGMREKERTVTESFLDSLKHIEFTKTIARKSAEYYRKFRAKGVTLELADLIVAATANLHSLTLITYNTEHFPMKDVKLLDIIIK